VQLVKKTGRTSASAFLEALTAAVPLQDPHGPHRQWHPVHFPAALRRRPDGKIHDAYD
jgi:hypothetical protein